MRLIKYAKLRACGFTHFAAAAIAERPLISSAAWYCAVAATAVLVSIATAQAASSAIESGQQDAAQSARAASAATVDRLERVVVSCLNGGFISVGGTAFECRAESMGVKL